jgi:hypothetical protein
VSDPWEYTIIALDFEAKIFCEHGGESFRGAALANAVEKLLGDRDILVLAHGYPFSVASSKSSTIGMSGRLNNPLRR